MRKDAQVWEQLSAEERALIVEREVIGVIDARRFRFSSHHGWLKRLDDGTPYCGCLVGGIGVALSPSEIPAEKCFGFATKSGIVATGLVTSEELQALEEGYEGTTRRDSVRSKLLPFWDVGARFRARPDATPISPLS